MQLHSWRIWIISNIKRSVFRKPERFLHFTYILASGSNAFVLLQLLFGSERLLIKKPLFLLCSQSLCTAFAQKKKWIRISVSYKLQHCTVCICLCCIRVFVEKLVCCQTSGNCLRYIDIISQYFCQKSLTALCC